MIKVPQYNIQIHPGADYKMDLQFLADDEGEITDYSVMVVNGILYDGSGCTYDDGVMYCTSRWSEANNTAYYSSEIGSLKAQLREYPEAIDYFDFEISVDKDGYHFVLNHDVTEKIAWSYGVYDVFLIDSDGNRTKILTGDAEIITGGTRW